MPERNRGQTVEQYQPVLKHGDVSPRRRRAHTVKDEDYAGFQHHNQLHANDDRERNQRQNHQRNGHL